MSKFCGSRVPFLSLIVGAVVVSGCAATDPKLRARQVASLGLMHFEERVALKDDDLETAALISTRNAFQPPLVLTEGRWADEFIRAFIDKKTGARRFQVYVQMFHDSGGWQDALRVNYGDPLKSSPVTKIGRRKKCQGRKGKHCLLQEHIAFDVSEAELREVTASTGEAGIWRYRIKMLSGRDFDGHLPVAEIKALLGRVDAYSTAKGLPMAAAGASRS